MLHSVSNKRASNHFIQSFIYVLAVSLKASGTLPAPLSIFAPLFRRLSTHKWRPVSMKGPGTCQWLLPASALHVLHMKSQGVVSTAPGSLRVLARRMHGERMEAVLRKGGWAGGGKRTGACRRARRWRPSPRRCGAARRRPPSPLPAGRSLSSTHPSFNRQHERMVTPN